MSSRCHTAAGTALSPINRGPPVDVFEGWRAWTKGRERPAHDGRALPSVAEHLAHEVDPRRRPHAQYPDLERPNPRVVLAGELLKVFEASMLTAPQCSDESRLQRQGSRVLPGRLARLYAP